MPPKPTCKVVKREGQRGARIDPKGCKVRTTKDAQGNKKKQNKQGQEKIKRTTTKKDMRLAVAGSPQRHLIANWNDRPQNFRSNYKRNHNMVYDTGANITSMTPAALQHIGYNPNRTTNVYPASFISLAKTRDNWDIGTKLGHISYIGLLEFNLETGLE